MPLSLHQVASGLDAQDPLAAFRDRFYIPPNTIYLDGNSLGLLSRDAEDAVYAVLAQWRNQGVAGWTEAEPNWYSLAETLAEEIAPLLGVEPQAIAITGSTTANLHQLLATLFQPSTARSRLLADALNFPSDLYAMESQLRLHGLNPESHLRKVHSRDGRTLEDADIEAALTEDIAVMVLPSVLYASGHRLDIRRWTVAAHQRGILVGWDLSHSIGILPHMLDEDEVDFAIWCHYKYLNAGPGAVGGLYLNRRHWDKLPGLAGWWGSDKQRQFAMSHTFTPAVGAGALQIGTPPILAMAPLLGAVRIHREAGIERIWQKSLALTNYLRKLVQQELTEFGFSIATPEEETRRGGHLALIHPEAASLGQALRLVGVVPDYRPPDILRLTPVPLYISFADCVEAVQRLKTICKTQAHRNLTRPGSLVT